MRKIIFVILSFLMVCFSSLGFAKEYKLEIESVNDPSDAWTEYVINNIYIVPAGADTWGTDLFESELRRGHFYYRMKGYESPYFDVKIIVKSDGPESGCTMYIQYNFNAEIDVFDYSSEKIKSEKIKCY